MRNFKKTCYTYFINRFVCICLCLVRSLLGLFTLSVWFSFARLFIVQRRWYFSLAVVSTLNGGTLWTGYFRSHNLNIVYIFIHQLNGGQAKTKMKARLNDKHLWKEEKFQSFRQIIWHTQKSGTTFTSTCESQLYTSAMSMDRANHFSLYKF